MQHVSIGIPHEPLGSLLIIAMETGMLAEEGVDVTVVDSYPSGKRALLGMLDGEVDVALSSEVPLMRQAFARDDFRIVATVGVTTNEPRIVARRDSGISKPLDLRGKRVATQRGSAVHYFLHLFLLRFGLTSDDVVLSFMAAEELPRALVEGTIDAYSMREPFIGKAVSQLGDNIIVFEQPGLYTKTMNLVATDDFISAHPEVLSRIVRALTTAEGFVEKHPGRAMHTVSQKLGIADTELKSLWPEMTLEVSLGHFLAVALDDEAQWAIQNDLVATTSAPGTNNLFYVEAVRSVKPAAMTLLD